MHNKETNNKMTNSKGMSLRTKGTPTIAITLLRSGSSHMRAGEADLLEREHEEQVWTEETCQEQGQTAVDPYQHKDMPTGRYKGVILYQLSFLSTKLTLRTLPETLPAPTTDSTFLS